MKWVARWLRGRRRRLVEWIIRSVKSVLEALGLRHPERPTTARQLGALGERLAARHLRSKGLVILRRSIRDRYGEIDLIALDGRRVVFVEVKTRASCQRGLPAEAVDRVKRQRLHRAANFFLKRQRLWDAPTRFDIVSVEWPPNVRRPTIVHIEDAFD